MGGEALADAVDWTTKGAVTPVKNQGQCGSCWSFSTTGALEGAYEIASGNLVSLSEQQFVDCDKVDSGCSGGLMDNGFNFAKSNALCTEASYPYKAKGGTCAASSCTVGLAKGAVTGYKDVSADSESAMISAVTQQPVSIAIEADKSVFQLYKSGVLQSTCGSQLDHGVLLVGYGTEDGKDYWKVKNSWGSSWGDAGYVKCCEARVVLANAACSSRHHILWYPVMHLLCKSHMRSGPWIYVRSCARLEDAINVVCGTIFDSLDAFQIS